MKKPRNKFESRIARQLKRSRVVYSYESERLPYTLSRKYIPDFIIEVSGHKIYIETKGYLRPEDKSKLRAVKQQHPDLDIRLVFYREVPSQIRWAEKNGFPYACIKIPREWFKSV